MRLVIDGRTWQEQLQMAGIRDAVCILIETKLRILFARFCPDVQKVLTHDDQRLVKATARTFLTLVESSKLKALGAISVDDIIALIASIAIATIRKDFGGKYCVANFRRLRSVHQTHANVLSVLKSGLTHESFALFCAVVDLLRFRADISRLGTRFDVSALADFVEALGALTMTDASDLTALRVQTLFLKTDVEHFSELVLLELSPVTGQLTAGLVRLSLLFTRLKSTLPEVDESMLTHALCRTQMCERALWVTDPVAGENTTRTLPNTRVLALSEAYLQALIRTKEVCTDFRVTGFESLFVTTTNDARDVASFNGGTTVLSFLSTTLTLSLVPSPFAMRLREALRQIERQLHETPALSALYLPGNGSSTLQAPSAVFVPVDLFPLTEGAFRQVDALIKPCDYVAHTRLDGVAFGQTIDAQKLALTVSERKALAAQPVVDDTLTWPVLYKEKFVRGFVFVLDDAVLTKDAVARWMIERLAECRQKALAVATEIESRSQSFLNQTAVNKLLQNYDADFMDLAANVSLADVIKRHPSVHLKLAMMAYTREKRAAASLRI
ncbi:MAG: hypothetical protein Q4E62_04050 [Sutterellaceae bacterium]|nr:hypothetical protein [Sutterellaceae bacterium]